jgi:hypothetical protein
MSSPSATNTRGIGFGDEPGRTGVGREELHDGARIDFLAVARRAPLARSWASSWTAPIIVDEDSTIIAGHGRYPAARKSRTSRSNRARRPSRSRGARAVSLDRKNVDWMEKVSDEQYRK